MTPLWCPVRKAWTQDVREEVISVYKKKGEKGSAIGRNAEMGRSMAPRVLVTGRASSEDGMFQRNMLPIHGGQEIKLSLSPSPLSPPSP